MKYKVIDAKVEIEQISVNNYYTGKLPVVYFKTDEHGWVQRAENNLPPGDTSPVTARKEAKASVGRLIKVWKHHTGKLLGRIIPHARVVVSDDLLKQVADRDCIGKIIAYAPPWMTIKHIGRENGLDIAGYGSDSIERFEFEYVENDEIKKEVTWIFDEYFDGLQET